MLEKMNGPFIRALDILMKVFSAAKYLSPIEMIAVLGLFANLISEVKVGNGMRSSLIRSGRKRNKITALHRDRPPPS